MRVAKALTEDNMIHCLLKFGESCGYQSHMVSAKAVWKCQGSLPEAQRHITIERTLSMIMRHPEGEDERHQQVFDEDAPVAQQAEAAGLNPAQYRFKSGQEYHNER